MGGAWERMKCNPSRWLWGLIPIAMLTWGTFFRERPNVEADLTLRAEEALSAVGQPWATVRLDGRDAIITGRARKDGEAKVALDAVRGVWGIRTVQLRTDLAGAPSPSYGIGPSGEHEVARKAAPEELPAANVETLREAEREAEAVRQAQQEAETARLAEAEAVRRAKEDAERELRAAEAEAIRVQEEATAEARRQAEVRREAEEAAARRAQAATQAALKAQRDAEAAEAAQRARLEELGREADRLREEARAEAARRAQEADEQKARLEALGQDAERLRSEAEATAAAEREREEAEAEAAEAAERARAEAEAAAAEKARAEAMAREDAERRRAEAEAAAAKARAEAEAREAAERQRAEAEAAAAEKARVEAVAAAAAEYARAEAAAKKAREEAERAARKTTEETRACEKRLAEAAERGVILFGWASADIDRKSMRTIARLADIVKACPGTRVEVEGHTDSEGIPERNQPLSERRAQAVVDSLIEAGVPAERLTSVGYAAERPVATNDTVAGRAKNRRIEFRVFID